jgi:hypothetical protein
MMRPSRFVGAALMTISLLAVADTGADLWLSVRGFRTYDNHMIDGRRFAFAGHRIVLEDDQPIDTVSHERETPGMLTVSIDGRAVGAPARVGVRRGRPDTGRYHTWFTATVFTSRATADSSLWLARKVRLGRRDTRYELTEIRGDGSTRTRMLRGWQLGLDYRTEEATGLLTWDSWWPTPLDLSGFVFVAPLLLIYPIGTFVLGVVLWRRGRERVMPSQRPVAAI